MTLIEDFETKKREVFGMIDTLHNKCNASFNDEKDIQQQINNDMVFLQQRVNDADLLMNMILNDIDNYNQKHLIN